MSASNARQLENDPPMVVAKIGDTYRAYLEMQIQQGFAAAFDADIHDFYPLLSQLSNGRGECVLGLRFAEDATLFLESYLDKPIERYLPEFASRSEIAELGNLYSTHRSATIEHFIVIARALLSQNIHFLAFTGTLQVRKLMQLLQVPVIELGEADAKCVESAKDYGTYYEANPKTCIVDLRLANQTIESVALYSKIAIQVEPHIEKLKAGLIA
ncbi:thermostable hemolysin (plasmid) [Pseudoalteromonas xiamenensis]|uniref:thermostable hemolysin n=1 Tax=Pseudoalteromonas xiamenensis TaxID=882626 RepID=UPI0027E4C63C|nr:thermostable hemolysin [Pseudoalteromonas xiamenensis]WMN61864.1 thermostable hemolysin [Pseudoalteromonas xiamenensis]